MLGQRSQLFGWERTSARTGKTYRKYTGKKGLAKRRLLLFVCVCSINCAGVMAISIFGHLCLDALYSATRSRTIHIHWTTTPQNTRAWTIHVCWTTTPLMISSWTIHICWYTTCRNHKILDHLCSLKHNLTDHPPLLQHNTTKILDHYIVPPCCSTTPWITRSWTIMVNTENEPWKCVIKQRFKGRFWWRCSAKLF